MSVKITSGQTSTGLIVENKDFLYVSKGGVASSTEVNSGGSMLIYSGGIGSDSIVNGGGRIFVSSGAVANNTTANGKDKDTQGQLWVSKGGIANNTTLNSFGYLHVMDGGSASNAVLNGGQVFARGGEMHSATVNQGGILYASSFVSKTEVNQGGQLVARAGAMVLDTVVNHGGRVTVSAGTVSGVVLTRTADGSGRMDVYGGEVNNTIVSGLLCISGGVANKTQVYSGGSMYLRNMVDKTTNAIISYGTASGVEIFKGGRLEVEAGIAKDVVVSDGGYLLVETGTAEDIQVSKGGILNVSGGVINDTVIASGGKVSVYNDAVLNGVRQQSGTLVLSGGTLNGATVNGGFFQVHSGVANDVTIDTEKDILVRSGAEINNMTVNGGKVVVYSGGVIKNTAMNTAKELGADQYDLTVSAGGTVKGTLELSGSAKMVFRQNSFLELSVCDMDATSDYLINDVSRITNVANAKTTAVLSADQTVGAFRIALNGNTFKQSVTVVANGVTLGSLTANGGAQTWNGIKYELVRGGGKIHLTVGNVFFIDSTYSDGKTGNYKWNVNAQATVAGAVEQNADVVYVLGGKMTGTTAFDCTTGVIENTTGAAMVLGGVRHEGESKRFTTIEKDISLTILNGKFNSNVIGGTALVAGSVEQKGDIVLNIAGGTFAKQVAGGMYHASDALTDQTILEGNVNFTISGGTFNGRVYGGSFSYNDNSAAARSTLIGNVNLTIDASEKLITFQKDVVAGSRHTGVIEGDVTVTVSGLGSNLSFDGYLWGGCSGDYYQSTSAGRVTRTGVTGSRTVNFTGFTGDFDANIYMFDTFVAGHDTDVNFTNAKLNLSDVKSWTFKSRSTIAGVAINNFTGDTLVFDTTGLGDAAWEMYSGSVAGFDQASSVILGGQKASWDGSAWASADYKLTLDEEENSLILSKLA